MSHLMQELDGAVSRWDERRLPRPRAVVVTGSGLHVDLGAETQDPLSLAEVVPFDCQAVEGHAHDVAWVQPLDDRPVVVFRGRLHAYQGYTPAQVVFPIRLSAMLGAQVLILTNAAGSLHSSHPPGALRLIRDHLNLTGLNPLAGELPTEWGSPFLDMSAPYDGALRHLALGLGNELGAELAEVTYAGLLGPSYETPAETRMLVGLGADLVGMSTVLEVIAARQLGMRCLGFSLVTNFAGGEAERLEHAGVLSAALLASPRFESLLRGLIVHPDLLD